MCEWIEICRGVNYKRSELVCGWSVESGVELLGDMRDARKIFRIFMGE